MASSMPSSITENIQTAFHVNAELSKATVFLFLSGYVFGPLFWGPLSELYGFRWLLIAANLGFVIFNVACALSPNIGALIVFRILAGFFGACSIASGAAVVPNVRARPGASADPADMGPGDDGDWHGNLLYIAHDRSVRRTHPRRLDCCDQRALAVGVLDLRHVRGADAGAHRAYIRRDVQPDMRDVQSASPAPGDWGRSIPICSRDAEDFREGDCTDASNHPLGYAHCTLPGAGCH